MSIIFSLIAVDALHDLVLHLVDLAKVAHQHLRPAILVVLPTVEAVGGIEVGEAHLLVILLEVGLVDARDGEAARAHLSGSRITVLLQISLCTQTYGATVFTSSGVTNSLPRSAALACDIFFSAISPRVLRPSLISLL